MFSPSYTRFPYYLFCMWRLSEIKDAIAHLLFPHLCDGCGTDIIGTGNCLCLRCLHELPQTHFEILPGNPVEKRFYGRLPLLNATSNYFFTKNSLAAHLVYEIKYKGNRELGWQMGIQLGESIKKAGRFNVDLLIPLPLFPAREKKRGYNQSLLLCEGMARRLPLPILSKTIIRDHHTDSQTRKGRVERWQNMEGKFRLIDPESIRGKHILLVDDVMTTGATLESCGLELLKSPGSSISIATLCMAFS